MALMQDRQPDVAVAGMKRQPDDAAAWIGFGWMLASSVILILVGLGLCLCAVIDGPAPSFPGRARAAVMPSGDPAIRNVRPEQRKDEPGGKHI